MPDRTVKTMAAAYALQEEKTYASSHAIARELSKAVPKRLLIKWRSQSSTDPMMRPLTKLVGLQVSVLTLDGT